MINKKPQFGPVQYLAGTVIINQGDTADMFYIVSRGRVEVITQKANGREQLLNVLEAGDYFGEVGIATQSRRNATVRALTNVNLMRMDRQTFTNWIRSSDVVHNEMDSLIQRRTRPEVLQHVTGLAAPAPNGKKKPRTGFFETKSIEHMRMYVPGEAIVEQDDIANEFFIIVEGEVEVTVIDKAFVERPVAFLTKGDYFGEIGLLSRQPRIATVRARTSVKVITFDRESFRSWMGKSPDSQHEIVQTAVKRRKDTGFLSLPATM